jgi:hypothetical protein
MLIEADGNERAVLSQTGAGRVCFNGKHVVFTRDKQLSAERDLTASGEQHEYGEQIRTERKLRIDVLKRTAHGLPAGIAGYYRRTWHNDPSDLQYSAQKNKNQVITD